MNSIFGAVWKSPKVAKLLIVQQFFEGFVPIMALYAIMFGRVGGLNLEQIGLLFALWGVAYVAAELPSGVLADYWSRKQVMVIGGLLRASGFAIWIIWPNFTGYAVGFALWGIQIACSSGALAAYLHNELRAQGHEAAYARYFGWVMSALSVGTLAGFFTAAVLTLDHTNILIGMSVASSLLLAFILIPMKERSYKRQETYIKTLRAGFAEIVHSKEAKVYVLRFIRGFYGNWRAGGAASSCVCGFWIRRFAGVANSGSSTSGRNLIAHQAGGIC